MKIQPRQTGTSSSSLSKATLQHDEIVEEDKIIEVLFTATWWRQHQNGELHASAAPKRFCSCSEGTIIAVIASTIPDVLAHQQLASDTTTTTVVGDDNEDIVHYNIYNLWWYYTVHQCNKNMDDTL